MRGAKQQPYSQDKLLLVILNKGGSFTELELGKLLYGEEKRGARSLVAGLRRAGIMVADKLVINPRTGRVNKCYYLERDKSKYIGWALNNGFFNFKPGAPTA